MNRAILNKEQLAVRVKWGKYYGKTFAFANGCFDLFHVGHAHMLYEASKLADYVIVALNTDDSIRRLKGAGRPIISLDDRAGVIASIRWVNMITYFEEDTPEELIKAVKPNIIVKGEDWEEHEVVGAEYVDEVVIIPYKYQYATTSIIDRIKRGEY